MDSVAEFFRWLNETYGMNFSIFYDSYDQSRFLAGFRTTLALAGACISASLVLGVVCAFLQRSRSRFVRGVVNAYVQAFRNTPQLVQLAFFYFAFGALLPKVQVAPGMWEPLVSNFGWAVISLSLATGAFNAETFRSGIEAVPAATVEAAEALGYGRVKAFFYVILPMGLRICLPSLTNNLVALVKLTSLSYAIGVQELLSVCAQIWAEMLNVREMMLVLLVSYMGIVLAVAFTMALIERALRIPGYGR